MFFYILTSVKNTHIIKLVKVDDIMKGRIIVIEGTDCSGKETKASLLVQRLKREGKKIEIEIDGNNQRVIFSDSGPGIREDIKNYIFEPFFSGKGEDGRGLGLYIAKQLLDRYDYNIDLADTEKDRHLKGANFVLDFSKKE